MKSLKSAIPAFGAIILLTLGGSVTAQTKQIYQQMTPSDRTSFVAEQARTIARRMSNSEYEFTPSFETEIQKSLDAYLQRMSNNGSGKKTDPRVIVERGQSQAPTLIQTFKARKVSPLIGLYIPWIESEYVNIPSANPAGAIGMFQFLPKTGMHFGLTPEELLDVTKSADAAARYILKSLKIFEHDKMKEALALLAYNRGENNVESDVALLVNDQNRGCSICAITEQRDRLNSTVRDENVSYVPRFFAAAIIGENPQAFGIQAAPLSSL